MKIWRFWKLPDSGPAFSTIFIQTEQEKSSVCVFIICSTIMTLLLLFYQLEYMQNFYFYHFLIESVFHGKIGRYFLVTFKTQQSLFEIA